jgi:hypothetical protein
MLHVLCLLPSEDKELAILQKAGHQLTWFIALQEDTSM